MRITTGHIHHTKEHLTHAPRASPRENKQNGVLIDTMPLPIRASHIESNVFALIGKWLVLMTPLGEPCHVLQRKLGLALEAAGPTHVDYLAAVNRQRGVQWGTAVEGVAKVCAKACAG